MKLRERIENWAADGSFIPAVVILTVAFILALTLARCSEGRVERYADRKWETGQTASVAVAEAAKAVTETSGKAAAARIEETTSAAIETSRNDAAAARQRVRDRLRANRSGGAGRADLPGAAGAAGQPDDPAGAELVVVQGREIDRLHLALGETQIALINTAEEGDLYRLQVLGWQALWRELEASWAAGRAVAATQPEPTR